MAEIKKLNPDLIHRANSNSFGGKRGDISEHDYEVYCNRVLEWPISEEKKQKILDKIYEKHMAILSHEASHVSVIVAGPARYNAKKLAQRLNRFSKDQIIRAISESYQASYILETLINDLEYRAQEDLLAKHSSAIDAERRAAEACMDWRREMCDKYGHGGECRLADIPAVEVARGAKLEKEWKAAQEKERALDKQVNKTLGIGGTSA